VRSFMVPRIGVQGRQGKVVKAWDGPTSDLT
jgi:hypothetical protein